ncbi:14722_t:CDS:2, partial [Dentiscutata heterogama]
DNTPKTLISKQQVGNTSEASSPLISPNCQVSDASEASRILTSPTINNTSESLISPNQQVGNTSSETSSTSDKLQLQYANHISLSPDNEFESTDIELNSVHKVRSSGLTNIFLDDDEYNSEVKQPFTSANTIYQSKQKKWSQPFILQELSLKKSSTSLLNQEALIEKLTLE